MIYENVMQAVFLSRPNRFLARVLLNGNEAVCHVKKYRKTGRAPRSQASRRRCSSIQTPWPREGKQNTR